MLYPHGSTLPAPPHTHTGGRYLSDTWALNLENLTWKAFVHGGSSKAAAGAALPASSAPEGAAVPPPPPGLPAIAGHVAVPWQGNVVLVGGHMKVRRCGVYGGVAR